MELNTQTISTEALAKRPHATRLTLNEIIPQLMSPDSGKPLHLHEEQLSDGAENNYPFRGTVPLLLPTALLEHFSDRLMVPASANRNAFMQYFLLSSIKQSGEINAPSTEEHYRRHLYRAQEFLTECKGLVLDVGCDCPEIGASLFPKGVSYVGLDPFCQNINKFRLVGVGEFLPLQDASFDNVFFNTSLDHILDWHRAIDEARRVLRPGGSLYISSLVWTQKAELFSDSVHFHHFREYEILQGLQGFSLERTKRYDYKGDQHRYGLYLQAVKK